MSRGLGRVQRRALEALEAEGPLDLWDLACSIYETENPTLAQYESVRRALKRLAEQELVTDIAQFEPLIAHLEGREFQLYFPRRWGPRRCYARNDWALRLLFEAVTKVQAELQRATAESDLWPTDIYRLQLRLNKDRLLVAVQRMQERVDRELAGDSATTSPAG